MAQYTKLQIKQLIHRIRSSRFWIEHLDADFQYRYSTSKEANQIYFDHTSFMIKRTIRMSTERPVRKTIEYNPEDLYFKFQFSEANGKKHWSVHRIQDMNTKQPPVGIASQLKPTSETIIVKWANES